MIFERCEIYKVSIKIGLAFIGKIFYYSTVSENPGITQPVCTVVVFTNFVNTKIFTGESTRENNAAPRDRVNSRVIKQGLPQMIYAHQDIYQETLILGVMVCHGHKGLGCPLFSCSVVSDSL